MTAQLHQLQQQQQRRRRFICAVLGRPCSANRMHLHVRGRVVLSQAAQDWESSVWTDAKAQLDIPAVVAAWQASHQAPIAVDITFHGVRGDVDNYAKTTLDGLKLALGIDDAHFSPVHLHRGAQGRGVKPGADIILTLVDPQDPEEDEDEADELPTAARGSLRMHDLLSAEAIAHIEEVVAPPITQVMVYAARDYGAVVLLFPPSPLAEHADGEWGTFLPLEQARQLRRALNALPELADTDQPPQQQQQQQQQREVAG